MIKKSYGLVILDMFLCHFFFFFLVILDVSVSVSEYFSTNIDNNSAEYPLCTIPVCE